MPNLTWVIEESPYDRDKDAQKLCDEVLAQNHSVIMVKYKAFNDFSEVLLHVLDSPSIFHGCIESATRYNKLATSPGPYYDPSSFYCSKYAPALNSYYVNWNARYIPAGLFEALVVSNQIPFNGTFVRTDSGKKFFTPRVVYPDDGAATLLADIDHSCTPTQMIMLCPVVELLEEFRVLIVDGKAITASKYHTQGQLDISPGCPDHVSKFAVDMYEILRERAPWMTPNGVCFIDVGIENIRGAKINKVVEVSAFGCAGLYACDIKKVVESISHNALTGFNHGDQLAWPMTS